MIKANLCPLGDHMKAKEADNKPTNKYVQNTGQVVIRTIKKSKAGLGDREGRDRGRGSALDR